jgi:OFA family oxalate/formate antiporter-like MFS transporter
MTTALGGLSIVGRLGFGWLGDRLGQKAVYAGGLIALMVGFVVLAGARGLVEIAIFLLLYGPAYGGLAAQMLALRGQFFGRRSFATIGGLMAPVMTLGTITGPVYAGWIFDTTGSYRLAMLSFAAMMLLALALLWKLPRPRVS